MYWQNVEWLCKDLFRNENPRMQSNAYKQIKKKVLSYSNKFLRDAERAGMGSDYVSPFQNDTLGCLQHDHSLSSLIGILVASDVEAEHQVPLFLKAILQGACESELNPVVTQLLTSYIELLQFLTCRYMLNPYRWWFDAFTSPGTQMWSTWKVVVMNISTFRYKHSEIAHPRPIGGSYKPR